MHPSDGYRFAQAILQDCRDFGLATLFSLVIALKAPMEWQVDTAFNVKSAGVGEECVGDGTESRTDGASGVMHDAFYVGW